MAPPIPINVDIVDAASHIGGADRPCVRMGSATFKNEQRQHTVHDTVHAAADEGSGIEKLNSTRCVTHTTENGA